MKRKRFYIAAAEQRAMYVYLAALLLCRGGYAVESAAASELTVRPGFTAIDSIAALRDVVTRSGQKIRMKPGAYRVVDAWPGDPKTVFRFSGSDNYFDLRGVTLQIDTRILAEMPRGKAHELGVYRVEGSRITFEGALFEDVGDHPPRRSLTEFSVSGDDVSFKNCRFVIRGSAPYGYGDLYGKGRGAAVWLQKHSGVGISGDRCLIEDCDFRIFSFGHGIHMHGAQDTAIRNVTMLGELRRSDELYQETSGPAAKYDYQIMYPPWRRGRPIPKGQMISLTEDGIRAYAHTGHVTVEDCTVTRMRGGITITMASGAKVTNCTVIDSGGHAYSFPSNASVRNCRGNAAYAPLLRLPYAHKRNADIELTLVQSERECGDHPLATVVGKGHRIKLVYSGRSPPAALRPILLGDTAGRYTEENTAPAELAKNNRAKGIVLENLTPHPVHLSKYTAGCRVTSRGNVEDRGRDNQVSFQ
jgi:hypothetical protein